MSLLMQALRKAEAKKKLDAGAAADTARPEGAELSLESQDPAPAAAAAPSAPEPESAPPQPAPAVSARPTPDDPGLEPQVPSASELAAAAREAEAAAAAEPVDYFSSDLPPPRTPVPAPEPVRHGFDPETGFSAAAPLVPAPAPSSAPEPERDSGPVVPVDATPAPPRLKLGIDAQQTADMASKQAVEARNAAGALFAAKARVRNRRPYIIGAVGLLVLGAAGAYGYMQYMRLSQPLSPMVIPPGQAVLGAVPDPAAPVAVVVTPVVSATPSGPATAVQAVATVTPAQPGAAAAAAQPGAAVSKAQPGAAVATTQRPAPDRDAQFGTAPRAAPTAGGAPRIATVRSAREGGAPARAFPLGGEPIEVRRNEGSRNVNPLLTNAYQAYVAGDMNGARTQYQRMLQQEPDNRDALLGMAAIALNRGNAGEAGSFYKRLLEIDPADADAATGMASVQRGDVTQTESDLKKVLAANPETGAALFSLGNVYAQQGRWSEAQQAYFRAVGAAPANPDYAFNLAVSLDKLNQGKLAIDYYGRALTLAKTSGSYVNPATVQERIRQLQLQVAAGTPR